MPATAAGGSTLTISATVTNTGGEQWGLDHYLAMRDSSGAVVVLESVEWVSPGETVTREIHYGLPNPVGTTTYMFTFQALEHNVEWFGSIDTRSVVVTETPPYVYTGMQLSPTTFSDAAHPLISTSDGVVSAPNYRLRAKVIDGTQYGFHMANEWNRNNYPVDTVRGLTPGDYATCALYWVTYSSYWGAVQSIGPERRVPITVRHAVELTAEVFHDTNPPNVRFGGALTGNYRLYATFRNSQGTWETAGGLNNNNSRIAALPPAGTYSVSLFYRRFDAGMNVIETSEVRTVTATITSGPVQVLSEGGTINEWTYENDDGWVLTGYSENTHWFYIPIAGTLRLRTNGVVNLSGSVRGMTGTEILAETPLAVSAGEWISVTVTGTTASGYYQIIGAVTPGFTAPTVTGAGTAAGVVGFPFASYTASANGIGPLVFSASNLPPGLSISPGAGVITGTPTAAGTYPVWIAAANAAGSNGKWVSFAIAPAIPPGKPTALVPVTIGSSVITLYWNAPTGSPSAASYEVEANNVSFGVTQATSMTLTGLTPGTLYNLKVRAASATGVWSQWSADYIAATAPAVAPGRSTSVWMELPHRQRDPNNPVLYSLYYTGIQDEILPFGPNGVIGFRWIDYQPSYTISAIGYDDGISLNDYWSLFNSSGADGSSVFAPRFEMPRFLFTNLTSLIASIEATYATKEGETYQVYEDSVGSPVFIPTNLDLLGEEFPSPSTGTHTVVFPNYELISVYRPSFYVVRRGKPIGGARITLPGVGPTTVGIRTAGGSSVPTVGPISIGGMTIDVGVGTGSIGFPGGGTISVNGGVVSVTGVAGLPNGPIVGTVGLGGLGSVEVDTAGNVAVTVGSAVPVMSGVVIRANAAGGGEITLANGVGIGISSTGRMGLTLPPGTDPTIVQAVDIATRILSAGAGAVISVRDALGVVTPLPTSGVLGAIDAAITSKGLYEVGIKLGTDSTFWFDVYTFAKPRIAVDANRDGVIAFDASDATTAEKPYRFWINDDDDISGGTATFIDVSTNTVTSIVNAETSPVTTADYTRHEIGTARNLEDFVRLWMDLSGLQSMVTTSGGIQVGLKWKNFSGSCAVNLYVSADSAGLDSYLKSDTAAYAQIINPTYERAITFKNNQQTVNTSGTFVFPMSLLQSEMQRGPVLHLLFEGAGIGTGQLEIVLLDKDGNEIGVGPGVWFDLRSVRSLYQRVKVTPRNPNGIPDLFLGDTFDAKNSGTESSDEGYTFVAPPDEAKTALVFVHGSNISYETAEWNADTMFKRLYWQGYKGRLVLFYWDTLVGQFDGTIPAHYNLNEYRALKYGWALKNYVENSLPSDYARNVVGHSLGSGVLFSALRAREAVNGSTIPGMTARNVIFMQAAMPASCLDSNAAMLPEFANLENPQATPDGFEQMGYRGMIATGVHATLFNIYNENDYALGWWVTNQRLMKPENLLYRGYARVYTWTATGGGQLWDWSNISAGPIRIRYVEDVAESMAFIARSRTTALGRMSTGGSISGNLNITAGTELNFGSGRDDHSGEFTRNVQELTPFYRYIYERAR